jgi:ABC-type oligopeptide transport system substrate-binding subunit
MKKLLLLFVAALTFVACSNNDYSFEDSVKANSEKVFGVSFPSSQDWNMTTNGIGSNIQLKIWFINKN